MDEKEQDEYIEKIEAEYQEQIANSKKFVGGLAAVVSAIYLFLAYHQIAYPWQLRHQAPFQGIVDASSVAIAELGAALTVGTAAAAVITFNSPQYNETTWRKILNYSLTLSLFMFGFWATATFKVIMATPEGQAAAWVLLWKPLAPGICVAAAVTVIDELGKTSPEIARLKASKYRLKKA